MPESLRLEELRRRVERDPASIAFAALAEEYRHAGRFRDAIDVCRAGLRRHPVYLSARVTLARTLLEVGEYDEARRELQYVLQVAPDNGAALQALDEVGRRAAAGPAAVAGLETAVPPPGTPPPADTGGVASATSRGLGPAPRDDAAIARLEQFLEKIRRAREALEPSARR